MKLKKGILLTALTFTAVIIVSLFTSVQAASDVKNLSIKEMRNTGWKYRVVNNENKIIWKIYDTVNPQNDTFYCIKGGPGFGTSDMSSVGTANYTRSFNMRTPNAIGSTYASKILSSSNSNYSKLMWVLDQCYIVPKAGASDEEKEVAGANKAELIAAVNAYIAQAHAGVSNYSQLDDQTFIEDFDVAQQLAVWYFTNDDAYHVTGNPSIETNNVPFSDTIYTALSNVSEDRAHDINSIFAYLTEAAPANYDYTVEKVEGTTNRYIRKITYWSVENPGATDQPIVELRRIPIENEKFDLALRKYITNINRNGTTVNYNYSARVPSISDSTKTALANGSIETLEKAHIKDALPVKTGDIVTYKIHIYNEGELDGWATEVTDYLPAGLKFLPQSQINQDYGWTNPSGDGKTIVTSFLAANSHKLLAFNKATKELDDDYLEIECEVTATEGVSDISLRNIAEITEHKDIYGNTQKVSGVDRDSIPGNLGTTVINDHSKYAPHNPTKGMGQEDDDDYEELVLLGQNIDLALRKFITDITHKDGSKEAITGRVPEISAQAKADLANGLTKTAEKVHLKDPKEVKNGDKVIYTIRIYNEGNISGYATEVTDYLPTGLKFVKGSTTNTAYGWKQDGNRIYTDYLKDKLLDKFEGDFVENKNYVDLKVECEVDLTVGQEDISLKNIAAITGYAYKAENGEKKTITKDRDSVSTDIKTYPNPYNPKNPTKGMGVEDDDDYEELILRGKVFDLSLRKFISNITNTEGKLVNFTSREPKPDVTPLLNGKKTANYNHTKEPAGVSNNYIVTYTLRVYNEGLVDGYVTEITDHLPSQLEYIVDDELNAKYGWSVVEGSNGRVVKTDITSPKTKHYANRDIIYAERSTGTDKVLLKAFGNTATSKLDYIDVQIRCRVKENIDLFEKITNIAEITGFTDSEGNKVVDRDSQAGPTEGLAVIPTDSTLPTYKDTEINRGNKYIPGQQDDDDFEKLVLQRFDLALRKFITGVVNGDKTTEITNRVPAFTKVSNTEYKYEHTKEPVDVAYGNTVIYTLRVFNEGNMPGYATKVKDNLPEGLEFLPENAINKAFGWKMYKEDGTETKDVKEAKYIETDFLSLEKETKKDNNLIEAFNPDTMDMPKFKDLKIAFKVTEPNTSDRIIINTAQISEDSDAKGKPVEDVDSTPNNNVPEEDDQDIEKVKVKYFDLSLKKWVTESIVTFNGKTTRTKSGHTGNENPEAPMKVEIQTANINKTTVKFKFNIKVTNEGDIAGYAKELIDYIPQGLKFVAKDNPKWKEVDGKVVTDQLKDTLLKPGESATVEIVLTWINGKNNMGEKVNWAEISKDYNEFNSPDIDSTPGNNVKGEDDIDQAPVLLSPATGITETYIVLALVATIILGVGIFLIKKFVI